MQIDIIDPDFDYLEVLTQHILSLDASIEIRTYTNLDSWEAVEDLKDRNYLLIYTLDFFPDFKPNANVLVLRDALPFGLVLGNSQDKIILRLGPIQEILDPIAYALEKSDLIKSTISPIRTYISYSLDLLEITNFKLEIYRAKKAGTKVILLEIGPMFTYTPSSVSAPNYLLDLSLEKVNVDTISKYLEPWPEDHHVLRLVLAKRSDDWFLAPVEYLRKTIAYLSSWCREHYKNKWKIFVFARMVPFQALKILASLSSEMLYKLPEHYAQSEMLQEELATLVGLLPINAQMRPWEMD